MEFCFYFFWFFRNDYFLIIISRTFSHFSDFSLLYFYKFTQRSLLFYPTGILSSTWFPIFLLKCIYFLMVYPTGILFAIFGWVLFPIFSFYFFDIFCNDYFSFLFREPFTFFIFFLFYKFIIYKLYKDPGCFILQESCSVITTNLFDILTS